MYGTLLHYLTVLYVLPSVLQPMLSALIVSLTFFPLFACADAPIALIGHILGFLYGILL